LDKSIAIREIVLVRKTGGKSGEYLRNEAAGRSATLRDDQG
jgi:hypothetical protein